MTSVRTHTRNGQPVKGYDRNGQSRATRGRQQASAHAAGNRAAKARKQARRGEGSVNFVARTRVGKVYRFAKRFIGKNIRPL